jgi:hypothetical protein
MKNGVRRGWINVNFTQTTLHAIQVSEGFTQTDFSFGWIDLEDRLLAFCVDSRQRLQIKNCQPSIIRLFCILPKGVS